MKQRRTILYLLTALVLVGVIAAGAILVRRGAAEAQTKTYDIILDYESLEDMARQSDESVAEWLARFREMGVDKLGLVESSLATLKESHPGVVRLDTVRNQISQMNWEKLYPAPVQQAMTRCTDKEDILVAITDPVIYRWALESYEERCDYPVTAIEGEDGIGYILLQKGPGLVTGKLMAEMPLGVLPEYLTLAEEYDYTVIPRTYPAEELNGMTFTRGVMEDYRQLATPYFIGGGKRIVGNDEPEKTLPELVAFLKETNMTIGVVEASDQSLNLQWEGLDELVKEGDYQAARVFSMWDYIRCRYKWYSYDGPEEITNCLYRAVQERSCRIIYLKMILDGELPEGYNASVDPDLPHVTDPEVYEEMLTELYDRLSAQGYTRETVEPLPLVEIPLVLMLLVAVGAIAAAVLLLNLVVPVPDKISLLLAAAGIVCAAGALVVLPNTGPILLSLGGGIVMPLVGCVGLAELTKPEKQRFHITVAGILGLLFALIVALVGAMFAAAPLSSSAYMLEMELYRGVKIMQLAPLGLFLLYLLKEIIWRKVFDADHVPLQQQKEALCAVADKTVKVRLLFLIAGGILLLAVAAVVMYYYLARTGHSTSVEASTLELELRNILEYYLPARPRTKEFLIGYPCLLLFVWARRKNLLPLGLVFGAGTAIGLTSVVNTLLHIRTLLAVSLVRIFIGALFGLAFGLVVVGVAELLYRLIQKRLRYV